MSQSCRTNRDLASVVVFERSLQTVAQPTSQLPEEAAIGATARQHAIKDVLEELVALRPRVVRFNAKRVEEHWLAETVDHFLVSGDPIAIDTDSRPGRPLQLR